jgi:hypothetical protein
MMSDDLSNQAIRKILGRTPNWIKPFDVTEYLDNRPMIEKLYEERQLALAKSVELEKTVSELSARIHQLELNGQRLNLKLSEHKSLSFTVFGLSLIATITIGIGVNVLTSSTYEWIGWLLVAIAAVLEIMAFWLTRKAE